MRREPACHGLSRSRWRLADLRAVLPWLAPYTDSGVAKALHRQRIRLKRGRLRLHSPDPAYRPKAAAIAERLAEARADPAHVALYYGDEASCYRQPTLASTWSPVGEEPTTPLSHRANTRYRLCGALDATSGRVVATTGSRTTVVHLGRFLQTLRAADPDRAITLVWDNWPVHAHPDVAQAAAAARIEVLWLPTYAPWLNPIEKLWRQLKQDRLHHHRLADDWEGLKASIDTFLAQFSAGSDELLRAVGLWSD